MLFVRCLVYYPSSPRDCLTTSRLFNSLASTTIVLQRITMAAQQNLSPVPDIKLRVLIIGRANAGKTSILQRVCDTTESPRIYRRGQSGRRERVRFSFLATLSISSSRQVQLDATTEVRHAYASRDG